MNSFSLNIVLGVLVAAIFYVFARMNVVAVVGNPNFDALLSTTLANYRRQFADNLSKSFLLFYWLTTNGRVRTEDGGESIIIQLLYGMNSTVKSYSGYETLDLSPQEGMTSAKFPWKQLAGTVSISGYEERVNSGKSRLINLLASKVTQLEISLRDALNRMFFGDGTGNDSKDIFGLRLIVESGTVSGWGTLAGIDRSDAANAWWRNQHTGSVGSFATLGLDKMRTLYNNCSRGNEHPDIGLADQTSFEAYEKLLVPAERFEDKTTGDAGFQNLKFKGMVLGFDEQAAFETAQGIYMLNSDYLEFVVDEGTFLKSEPFMDSINQDAKSSKNLTMANLVCSNCARQGVMDGITA